MIAPFMQALTGEGDDAPLDAEAPKAPVAGPLSGRSAWLAVAVAWGLAATGWFALIAVTPSYEARASLEVLATDGAAPTDMSATTSELLSPDVLKVAARAAGVRGEETEQQQWANNNIAVTAADDDRIVLLVSAKNETAAGNAAKAILARVATPTNPLGVADPAAPPVIDPSLIDPISDAAAAANARVEALQRRLETSAPAETAKLSALREELARLRAVFTDTYPDVRRVRAEISALEASSTAIATPESSNDVADAEQAGVGEERLTPPSTESAAQQAMDPARMKIADELRQARSDARAFDAALTALKRAMQPTGKGASTDAQEVDAEPTSVADAAGLGVVEDVTVVETSTRPAPVTAFYVAAIALIIGALAGVVHALLTIDDAAPASPGANTRVAGAVLALFAGAVLVAMILNAAGP